MAKDFASIAAQFGGVSREQVTQDQGYPPFMSELSLKDNQDLKIKMQAEGRKRLSDLSQRISEAQPTIQSLRNFTAINKEEPTGSVWDNIAPNSMPILHGDEANKLIAIQSKAGPSQRIEGSGTSSDRDVNLFMAGLPRNEQTREVNKDIANTFEAQYKYALDKQAAMQGYLDKYGHLNGFDTVWGGSQKIAPPPPTATSQKKTVKWSDLK